MTESQEKTRIILGAIHGQRSWYCTLINVSTDNIAQKKDGDNVHDENLVKQKHINMPDMKIDGTLTDIEMSPEFIELMEGNKTISKVY